MIRVRAGAAVARVRTLAPAQHIPDGDQPLVAAYRLFLPEGTDARTSDTWIVRGRPCQVTAIPDHRVGHALVVEVGQVTTADDDRLDCTVTIGPASGPGVFNPLTGQTESPATVASYTGPAAVDTVPTSDGTNVDAADEQVDDRLYTVTLPAGEGNDVEVDHVVSVTAAPNTELVGHRLVVTSIARPGRESARVVFARLYD